MAADFKDIHPNPHLSDIHVHSAGKHPHLVIPTDVPCLTHHTHYLPSENPEAGKFEFNGNYEENPELTMPGPLCRCDMNGAGVFGTHKDLDPENLEMESGLPYVVTDDTIRSLTSCQTCHFLRTFHPSGSREELHLRRHLGSSNGSYDGALERIQEDQDVSTCASNSLERCHSFSSVEGAVRDATKTVAHAQGEPLDDWLSALSSSADTANLDQPAAFADASRSLDIDCGNPSFLSSRQHSALPPLLPITDFSQHLPLITETSVEEDQSVSDTTEYLVNEADSGFDQSQNASIEEKEHTQETNSVKSTGSGALRLPLSFRFHKSFTPSSSSPKNRKLQDKQPAGPSSSQRGKSRPPPRQSWLLRLFESKMFDMTIAITYLYNSKEPGVQTYIGKWTFLLILKII